MGDHYFMVCRTCKRASWWNVEEMPLYIEGHEGHQFTIMTPDTFEDMENFRTWFLTFMGWPVEAEA